MERNSFEARSANERAPRKTSPNRPFHNSLWMSRRQGTSMGRPGFFDPDERYRRLSETGALLVRLAALVDFEIFRPRLDGALKRSDRSKGGRPPMDAVLMFEI